MLEHANGQPRVATRWCGVAGLLLAATATAGHAQDPAQAGTPPGGMLRFDRSVLLEQTAETSANVSIGDVDGDGHLDIVLVKGRHWPLLDMVLIGDGAGGFLPARPLGSHADRSYSGVLVDIDADGDLDVVISNDRPDSNVIHLNDGEGRFTPGSSFGRPEWPTRHVSVADLNGDGQPDIVVANRIGDRDGFSYVCLNRGEGRFDDDCIGFARESATSIALVDYDGDGRLDLLVPHRDGGQSYVYLNGGDGTFQQRIAVGPADAAIRKAEAADLNGDGLLDLVIIDERKGAAVLLRRQDGTLDAARPLGDPGRTPYALTVADLNGDGLADVIVGYVEARPIAFLADGRGGFQPVEFGDDQGVAYGFAVADVDGDGFMDIAMARSDAPNVLYFGSPAGAPRR